MHCSEHLCNVRVALLVLAVASLVSRAPLVAQQPVAIPEDQLLWQRYQAQQAELDELRVSMKAHSPLANANFESLAHDHREADASQTEATADAGYEVGSDLKMNARWNLANGVTLETANKDFVSHIGARFQLDFVGWNESPALTQRPFGTLEDGAFFRRIRPSWDGTAYDVMEWSIELQLEQTQNNVSALDGAWVGLKNIPLVNTVRVGHVKVTQGFEGDMMSTSKAMTFFERASYTNAFYETFATGFYLTNHIAEDHLTWHAVAYRQDNAPDANGNNTGADFNSGKWGYSGRITVLPFYQDDGRHMLHVAVSGTIRDAEIPSLGAAPNSQFRAFPEMRDQIGTTPLGNSNRLVDTGAINCTTNTVLGTELFYVLGPASLQAEYAWATMDNATGTKVRRQGVDLPFGGGYVQGSYFLTGENRTYERRFGLQGPGYIASPYTPFWLVKDANGDCCWGSGAWEVACRYSHLTLDNQYLVSQGGETYGLEFGVNWYLNSNLKLQFEYLHQTVYGGGPNGEGYVNGFGMRTQFLF